MHRPESIPEGEVGEVMEVRSLVNLPVEPQVISVGIVEDRRHLKYAEQRCVKHLFLRFSAALNPDRTEPLFPVSLRLGQDLIKILGPGFRLQVGTGVFDADVGNRQLERDGLRPVGGGKAQVNAGSISCGKGFVASDDVVLQGSEAGQRLAESGNAIHLNASIPSGERPKGSHRTLNLSRLRQHTNGSLAGAAATQGVHYIENQMGSPTLAERIAVDTDARGGGELREHTELGEPDGVVAGKGQLLTVGESRGLPRAQPRRLHGAAHRHHQEMPAISGASAVQPGVAEPEYLIVSIVIAR